jgi:hypothetical protein
MTFKLFLRDVLDYSLISNTINIIYDYAIRYDIIYSEECDHDMNKQYALASQYYVNNISYYCIWNIIYNHNNIFVYNHAESRPDDKITLINDYEYRIFWTNEISKTVYGYDDIVNMKGLANRVCEYKTNDKFKTIDVYENLVCVS